MVLLVLPLSLFIHRSDLGFPSTLSLTKGQSLALSYHCVKNCCLLLCVRTFANYFVLIVISWRSSRVSKQSIWLCSHQSCLPTAVCLCFYKISHMQRFWWKTDSEKSIQFWQHARITVWPTTFCSKRSSFPNNTSMQSITPHLNY